MNRYLKLQDFDQVVTRIKAGESLMLAGDRALLTELPKGNWIGGSSPYFMHPDGCLHSRDRLLVTSLPPQVLSVRICSYSVETLPKLLKDAPQYGFTLLILPSGSAVHAAYARDALSYPELFLKPVVGWVAGVDLADIGQVEPVTMDGRTGAWSSRRAAAIHATLPKGMSAHVEIVNVFHPGAGPMIRFPTTGFEATDAFLNREKCNFARYLWATGVDCKLPLTADLNGSVMNVSIQSADVASGITRFYAPVFAGVDYRIAAPVDDYVQAFDHAFHDYGPPAFSCNCVLNYSYGRLEGRRLGSATGPFAFGEIANLLMNQTMVRMFIRE